MQYRVVRVEENGYKSYSDITRDRQRAEYWRDNAVAIIDPLYTDVYIEQRPEPVDWERLTLAPVNQPKFPI